MFECTSNTNDALCHGVGVADAMSDKRTEAVTGKSSDERQTICAHE